MDNFYEKLKSYFENTPREQVLAAWESTEKYDAVGPTVDEFLRNTTHYKQLEFETIDIGENSTQYKSSPEPTSGFFYFNTFVSYGKSSLLSRKLFIR